MKSCENIKIDSTETRKAHVEKQNRLIQKKQKTPEPSILESSIFSRDISLNSLSLKSESEDLKENTFRNFSSRSKKPSEIYSECVTSKLSKKDQKILKLMAMRRETKMEECEMALIAKNSWEEERLQEAKEAEKKKASLKVYINRKNKIGELENAIRREHYNENLKQEKMILEMKISEKHEKVEIRQKELCLQKKLKTGMHTSRYQLQFHQELKKQKETEKEIENVLHRQEFEAKEKRSQEKLKIILMEKCRKLKEESLKRYLRWQAAKNVRDEMNKKCEDEKTRHLKYLEKNQLLQKERVHWVNEWRRKIILEKNEREKEQHAVNYNRVKEEEKERLNRTKRKILAKDLKIKALKDKREEAVLKSRSNARMTADLREKMRQTYNL